MSCFSFLLLRAWKPKRDLVGFGQSTGGGWETFVSSIGRAIDAVSTLDALT